MGRSFEEQVSSRLKKIMKSWILTVCIIATVSAFPRAEPEGCEQCRSGVKLLWENMRSAENVNREINLLDERVCGGDGKDPEACKTWFTTWWSKLAQMIYGEETVPYVCKEVSHVNAKLLQFLTIDKD